MKKLSFLFVVAFFGGQVSAQMAEDSVKAVVSTLFTAMKNSDSKLLLESFADSAILQTITAGGRVRTEQIEAFASQIGSLPKNAADERITFDMVKIDGALASVWTPYQFYYNGNFSHCGVNSFQLVRTGGTWKIQYIIDTRRKTVCQ